MNAGKYFRNAETIIVFICIIGLTFLLFDIPSGPMVVMIGLLTLSFFYMALGGVIMGEQYQISPVPIDTGLTFLARVISIICGLSLAIGIVGILFRLMHFPGWEPQLIAGMVGSGVGLIGSFVVIRPQEPKLHQYLFYRIVMVLGIGVVISRVAI